ncbi:MAG: exodeoxyribonuclease VII large subunit, partial [Treponema sp.]|nr:exodeoxyribonuclease VII large subunit [Treponema sp.]
MELKKGTDITFTVSQLTEAIRTLLENSFTSIQIKGEISNFKASAQGHLYFSLKDEGAQISAVMFRGSASALKFTPKDGMLIQARGRISVYAQRGNYQIIITSMEQAGEGAILEMIEKRKKQFAQEGLFDSARKRPLPFLPETVGIVTTPSGAGIRDIINIIKRRNPRVNVIVFPAVVQGETAAPSIVNMIKYANRFEMCDVLIVGRGGGSTEDLLPFSEEIVVRAVAESRIPVISAVGHEVDFALSDFAADVRAPTPSAAAELAVPVESDIRERISYYTKTLESALREKLSSSRLLLNSFTPENMHLRLRQIQMPLLQRTENAVQALKDGMIQKVNDTRLYLKTLTQTIADCSPQSILDRGYSMVRDAETGKIIRRADEVKAGTLLKINPQS